MFAFSKTPVVALLLASGLMLAETSRAEQPSSKPARKAAGQKEGNSANKLPPLIANPLRQMPANVPLAYSDRPAPEFSRAVPRTLPAPSAAQEANKALRRPAAARQPAARQPIARPPVVRQPVARRSAARQAAAQVPPGYVRRVSRAMQVEDEMVEPELPPEDIAAPEEPMAAPSAGSPTPATEGRSLQPVPMETDPESEMPMTEYVPMEEFDGCSDGSCDLCADPCCTLCGPPGRFWVSADYLLWWTKDAEYPPLLASSPSSTPADQSGVLGQMNTNILFGNGREDVFNNSQSGARIRFGMWLDQCHCSGLEGDYFAINDNDFNQTYQCDESDNLALARPFYNVQTGLQDSELVWYPGIVDGSATIATSSSFQGAGARWRRNLCCSSFCEPSQGLKCGPGIIGTQSCGTAMCGCGWENMSYRTLDFLAGYRFYKYNDGVSVSENLISTNTGGSIPLGTTFGVFDNFRATNDFHGGELGLHYDVRRGRWGFDCLALVALGNNRQVVDINGHTVIQVPGLDATEYEAGLLTQASNSGRYTQNDFIVIPQLNANLSYFLTCNLKLHVGYNLIYWDRVARAGDFIDLGLNPSQIPPGTLSGEARPAFNWNNTTFWAQGINIGGEIRF
ncbi:MAG: BBP7 family outer membrane beta-barrel protein [Pirellulales bacterium]|nr:BBP7 family outer membrane beta-barrel protein [Pirellulales bacterium]